MNDSGSGWDCGDDPIGKLKQLFIDIVQRPRVALGQSPVQRVVFRQTHGVACGRFEVRPDLPDDLKVGVFALRELDAWVRFSSDTDPGSPNPKATCGVGIKLFGVSGPKLIDEGDTQDFLLQNNPTFAVDTARDLCEFTVAALIDGDANRYLHAHPTTARILREMEGKLEPSALTATYWSALPYSFGPKRFVKYKLEPVHGPDVVPSDDDPDALALDFTRRLRAGDIRFRFMVQLQTDPDAMPLDRATVEWSERDSPPVHVATLVLPKQDAEAQGQASYGENLAFNPWHTIADHQPQGSLSEARRVVYHASAELRRNANGIPTREPGPPRPHEASRPAADTTIVRAAIHPSIGVARVGDSETEYFIGPEVSRPPRQAPGFYRDETGALKRQAARFRIYGLNASGKPIAELTADNAEIHWTVHLANKKAAWFEYQLAQDIPEASSAQTQLIRNIDVRDRASLVIDPGPRHISGRKTHGGKAHTFDTGCFVGTPVYLGELRTDEHGHLVVLGGRGKSASADKIRAITFANNEGWHDDVSDGPVTATVKFQGRTLKVDPAWVIVAPPNYGPNQQSVRTMWDLMRDVAINAGMLAAPARPSLQEDILPMFERLARLQWVNAGYAAAFGWHGSLPVVSLEHLRSLAGATAAARDARRSLMNQFRSFARDSTSPVPWPWLYGDAMNLPPPDTPRQFSTISDTQMAQLQQWVNGECEEGVELPSDLAAVAVERQPDVLDRAALDFCIADAFHPGCEMTWPMRISTMYSAPFRIQHAASGWVEPDYGVVFDPTLMRLPGGPFCGQLPGGITRWMAVPWQTDTASCRSGYEPEYDPYVPTFWPARVPNHVLTEAHYEIVMDETRPLAERLSAFAARAAWVRPLLKTTNYTDQINQMIEHFSELGVVEPREGLKDDPNFPPEMEVESLPHKVRAHLASAPEGRYRTDPTELRTISKVRRFPNGLIRRE